MFHARSIALPIALAFLAGCADDTPSRPSVDTESTDPDVLEPEVRDASDAPDSSDGTEADADDEPETEPDVDAAPDPDIREDIDAGPLVAGCASWSTPEHVGTLPSVLDELSGLAVTGSGEDALLWGHNDSGDAARIHAMTFDGRLVATVTLDVEARDFEDMARGPCGDAECLYVGDIGDNPRSNPSVRVHRFPVPAVDPEAEEVEAIQVTPETATFVYPDGPRDAEALVIDDAESVWIFAKDFGGSTAWSSPFAGAPERPLAARGTLDLSALPAGTAELVTGADWSRARGALLVRTYSTVGVLVLDAPLSGGDDPTHAPGVALPTGAEIQGEAVAWTDDGYVHAAEGTGAKLWRVRCLDARR
jgi:hypothetical protein